MRFSRILSQLAVARHVVLAAFPSPPTQIDDISRFNNSALLQQVALTQYIRNGQVAAYDYGIENVPKFGFSGYPRALIDNLKIWREQALFDLLAAERILNHFNSPIIPPCQYQFSLPFLGEDFNTTDAYLVVLLEFIRVSIGQNAYLVGVAGPIWPELASATAATASVESRRAAYIRTIAGVTPTPVPFDTVLPPAFAYWQLLYWTKPGTTSTCGAALNYPPFHPVAALAFDPPAVPNNLSPEARLLTGTRITFGFTNTTALPKFAALVNQVYLPQYMPLTVSGTAQEGNASFVIPETVKGVVFSSLVTSDAGKTLDEVAGNTVAGTFMIDV